MRNDEDESQERDAEPAPPVEIPADQLSPEALDGVIENFVTREGTDDGLQELAHDSKLERVRKQIAKGDIKIVFDPGSESVTLMTKHEWTKLTARLR